MNVPIWHRAAARRAASLHTIAGKGPSSNWEPTCVAALRPHAVIYIQVGQLGSKEASLYNNHLLVSATAPNDL